MKDESIYAESGSVTENAREDYIQSPVNELRLHTLLTANDEHLVEGLDNQFVTQQLAPYGRMFSSALSFDNPPVFCTTDPAGTGDIIGWFRASGVPVNIISRCTNLMHFLATAARCPSLIIIDIDTIDEGQESLELMLAIREKFFAIPTILVSKDYSTNDLGTSRSLMADMFLRRFPNIGEIEDFIDIAMENNRKWRARKNVSSNVKNIS